MIVAVATDNMLITSNSLTLVSKLKSNLLHYWGISDMGEAHWYLGFEIKRYRKAQTIFINQSTYLQSMAKKFHLADAKPVTTPMEPGIILSKEQASLSVRHAICRSHQKRTLASNDIIPDVAFSVGTLAQFIQNPALIHWEAFKRVIVYLNTTRDTWLTFGGADVKNVKAFCDADWASQAH